MTGQVYLVEWLGVSAYIRAVSKDKAKMRAMRAAREAGYWSPGKSLVGLKVLVATYVPPDAAVMDGT
jgi:hypothetical protein